MRLLYFADIRFPLERANGIQTMETCYALAERGHDVRLVVKPDTHAPARDPFEFYGLPKLAALIIERANTPPGAGFLQRVGFMSFVFGRAFGKTRADVILTRDLGVAAALVRMPGAARAPLVYESHGYAPDVAAALPDLISTARRPNAAKLRRLAAREEQVWRKADGYVTITHGLSNELVERFGPRDHVAVVPDGVRLPDREPPPLPAAPLVGYAGHLYAWKGVDALLHALVRVPGARGLIIGGHEEESDLGRVRALAVELGIADRVTFTGQLPPGDVAARLAEARVLVLPNPASAISTRFTSPLKLFEYMAARRPIVATSLPAVKEVLRDELNALLVEPDDSAAMAAAINRLLHDHALAERLAGTAYDGAPQYTWARRAERIETLLSEVTSSAA
jgi:glycosyltransferase involved in cell wall biosynthesis